jgi:hypothetical protein
MKYAALLIGAIGFATLLNTRLIARADDLAPSTILSNPASYDGQPVAVQGTIQNFSTRQTANGGTVSTYKVCDTQCVAVLDPGNGAQLNGRSATIAGTFHATLNIRGRKLTNIIVVAQ